MVGIWGLFFSGKIVEKFGEKSVIALIQVVSAFFSLCLLLCLWCGQKNGFW
jgi:MFS family permease